jgi:hypothetical protein
MNWLEERINKLNGSPEQEGLMYIYMEYRRVSFALGTCFTVIIGAIGMFLCSEVVIYNSFWWLAILIGFVATAGYFPIRIYGWLSGWESMIAREIEEAEAKKILRDGGRIYSNFDGIAYELELVKNRLVFKKGQIP